MIIDDFADEIKSQSNEELRRIVINFHMNRGALVAAAKRELISRGIELTEDEKNKIEEIKNKRKLEAISSARSNKDSNQIWRSFKSKWKILKKYSDIIILSVLWIVSVYSVVQAILGNYILGLKSFLGYGTLLILSTLRFFEIKKYKMVLTIFLFIGSLNLIQFTHSTISIVFHVSSRGNELSSIGFQPYSTLLLACFLILNIDEVINRIIK